MLTVEEVRKAEGTLLTLFLALGDALQALDSGKNQGKKTLESILDMQTQKNVLADRLRESNPPQRIRLYEQTTDKIEKAMIAELTQLEGTHSTMSSACDRVQLIHRQLLELAAKNHPESREFRQQSANGLGFLKTINSLIHYAKVATDRYPLQMKELGKIVSTIQKCVLGRRNNQDFSRVRYGLLVWVYEPAVNEDIYGAVRQLLADLHELRSAANR